MGLCVEYQVLWHGKPDRHEGPAVETLLRRGLPSVAIRPGSRRQELGVVTRIAAAGEHVLGHGHGPPGYDTPGRSMQSMGAARGGAAAQGVCSSEFDDRPEARLGAFSPDRADEELYSVNILWLAHYVWDLHAHLGDPAPAPYSLDDNKTLSSSSHTSTPQPNPNSHLQHHSCSIYGYISLHTTFILRLCLAAQALVYSILSPIQAKTSHGLPRPFSPAPHVPKLGQAFGKPADDRLRRRVSSSADHVSPPIGWEGVMAHEELLQGPLISCALLSAGPRHDLPCWLVRLTAQIAKHTGRGREEARRRIGTSTSFSCYPFDASAGHDAETSMAEAASGQTLEACSEGRLVLYNIIAT
ncbi:hypothetical protein CDD80_3835 [Ophiocordyceps camponoti-rufipedis]|uniref:Uncharacterized protein n=1 Tax=Ophiocordyceps camponoti-rufipedis TaxID=2004952 RepID=A0A2C5Z0L6_9HYPO|nr:hypothetical protein CDD80_3835 [Ophiocordyceps camponoti-rufipedis]